MIIKITSGCQSNYTLQILLFTKHGKNRLVYHRGDTLDGFDE